MLLCRSCEWRFIDIWPHTPTVYMVARFRLKNCSSYVTTLILDWWLNQLLHTNTGHTPGQDTESIEKSVFLFASCFKGRLCGCVQIQCINWYKRENQSTKKKNKVLSVHQSARTVTGTDEVVNRRIYSCTRGPFWPNQQCFFYSVFSKSFKKTFLFYVVACGVFLVKFYVTPRTGRRGWP